MMRYQLLVLLGLWYGSVFSSVVDRQLLEYASIPTDAYTPSVSSGTVTLLDLLRSRSELSNITAILQQATGFVQAFNTSADWKYTFFAPSNQAFENTGEYFETFAATPKGKWWLGNLVQHHYVPNTALKSTSFNTTALRFQTGSFLYVKAQVQSGEVRLNDVATVTEADIAATNGIVHIIDHILDPAEQIFEADLPKGSQSFIAGSCSNTALSYC